MKLLYDVVTAYVAYRMRNVFAFFVNFLYIFITETTHTNKHEIMFTYKYEQFNGIFTYIC